MADYTLSVEIDGDASDLENAFNAVKKSIKGVETSTSGASPGILGMAKAFGIAQLAIKGASMAMGAIKGSIDGAISRVDTLNKYPKVLQSMGHSGNDAKESIKSLADGIKGLPTTLDEIASTSQRMVTIMGDVPNATKSTLALNNAFLASSATADQASRGAEQYMQMLSRGKVGMEEWKTLQETMPYALSETAKAFGFTGRSATNDFYKALQEGDITMDQFNNKLIELSEKQGGFAEQAKTATEGIGTSFQNMKTAVTTGVANIIEKFNEWSQSRGYGTIYENLDKIKVVIQDVFANIVDKLPAVLDKVVELGQKFMEIYQILKPFLPAIMAVVGAFLLFQTIVSIAGALTGKITGITKALLGIGKGVSVIKGVGPAFSGLFKVVTSGFQTIYLKALYAFDGIAKLGGFLKGAFTTAFGALKGIVVTVFGAIKGVVISAFGVIKSIAITALGVLKAGFIKLFAVLMANPIILIVAGIVAVVAALIYAYKNFEGFRDLVNNVVSSIIQFFSELWTNITTTAVEAWTAFTTTLSEIWNGIVEIAGIVWEGLKTFFITIVDFIVQYYTMKWNLIFTVLSAIWNGIVTIATTLWEGLKNTLITIVTGIKTGIETLWNGLKTAVITIVNTLSSGVVGAWNALKGSVIGIANGIKEGAVRAWNLIKDGVNTAVAGVRRNFEKLRNINLFSIGKAIIDGFLRGIRQKFEEVKSFVGGIGTWIQNNKGPIQYDRKLLIPAGRAIMAGLNEGLQTSFKGTKNLISGMADSISREFENMSASANFSATATSGAVLGGFADESMRELEYYGKYTTVGEVVDNNPESSFGKDINITVVSELDGREISRATYKFDKEFQERDTNMGNRRKGEIY